VTFYGYNSKGEALNLLTMGNMAEGLDILIKIAGFVYFAHHHEFYIARKYNDSDN
jgi:hypothetical protein